MVWPVNNKCTLLSRERLSRVLTVFFVSALICSCGSTPQKPAEAPGPELVTYPEKGEMILLTDRPPQLETPLSVFKKDFTPNEYFFVRWHLSQIVTKIDADTFRLYIGGSVNKPLALSLNDLRTKFQPDSIVALAICAGNSRSTFSPRVPGTQWRNGGMGNAVWKGVKLKDILAMAGVKKGAIDVTFQGLDKAPLPATPVFVKSLRIDHAIDGEVMVAYEMNGQPIPMLNGFPLKLVVPGWYATYWVGALSNINVLADTFHGYWMDKAYQVTRDPTLCESPDSLAKATMPLTRINLHSVFVSPAPDSIQAVNKPCHMEGLAFDDGTGIKKVELSFDDGKSWVETKLNPELGKYAWRRWKYEWTPASKGVHHVKVKATSNSGQTQMDKQWNRSGYARGFIEQLEITVN